MARPTLLYDSRGNRGSFEASDTAPGFDVNNLGDWREFTFWQPQSLPASVDVDGASLSWDFEVDLEGWSATDANLSQVSGVMLIEATGNTPRIYSSTANTLQIDGSRDRYIVARFRRPLTGGTSWQGRATYRNAHHNFDQANFYSQIFDPSGGTQDVWYIAIWDMWALNAGGDDWRNSIITDISLEFQDLNGDDIEVGWIATMPELSADYFLLWGHDLGLQGITVELSAGWALGALSSVFKINEVGGVSKNETGDTPIVQYFTETQARFWRLDLTAGYNSNAPVLALLAVGKKFELPKGFDNGFDPTRREPRGRFSTSVTGKALGRVILHEEWRQTLSAELVTWEWLRETFEPAWLDHLRDEPYVVAWDRAAYPDDLKLVSSVGGYTTPHRPGGYADLAWEVVGNAP